MLSGGAYGLPRCTASAPAPRRGGDRRRSRLIAARALRDAGVEVVAVADLRADAGGGARPPSAGQVLRGRPVAAKGGAGDAACRPSLAPGDGEIDCDLLVVSGGSAPATSLLLQAGAGPLRRARRPLRARRAAGRRARGGRGGRPRRAEAAGRSGTLAGLGGVRAGLGDAGARDALARARRRSAPVSPVPRRRRADPGGKCFACLCEDVTAKDIHLSVAEGYDSIELSKRYTTATMGPCQGRMCQLPRSALMAAETGQSLERGRHDDVAAAVARRADGRAGRTPVRARQAVVDPRPPPRPGRNGHVGGRLAARVRLRRPARRGAGRARGGRADRRVDARQADRARARRRRAPRPPVSQPPLEPQARAGSATAS